MYNLLRNVSVFLKMQKIVKFEMILKVQNTVAHKFEFLAPHAARVLRGKFKKCTLCVCDVLPENLGDLSYSFIILCFSYTYTVIHIKLVATF